MKRNTRLAGHTLPNEGRILGGRIAQGSTTCSCGEVSPSLPSNSARRKWHADHKTEVQQAQDGTR